MNHYKILFRAVLAGLLCAVAGNSPAFADKFVKARRAMVTEQIAARGVSNPKLLRAMLKVPRHLFVRPGDIDKAYVDHPLSIGAGQTISQPYIVAVMTDLLGLKGNERILEIGTGSGYQAAVLSEICSEVYTIEIKKQLYDSARGRLESLGYKNVHARLGDGYLGWPEKAPFDGIMITAAVDHIPPPLMAQLKDGGKLILPLKRADLLEILTVATKHGNKVDVEYISSVLFVPMTGKAQE